MPLRCVQCRKGEQASKANSWKSEHNFCFWDPPQNEGSNLEIQSVISQDTTTTLPIPVPTQPTTSQGAIPDMTTQAGITTGSAISSGTKPCNLRGLTKETCHMQCNWDGSCAERVQTTKCGCDKIERISVTQTNFQVEYTYTKDCKK